MDHDCLLIADRLSPLCRTFYFYFELDEAAEP